MSAAASASFRSWAAIAIGAMAGWCSAAEVVLDAAPRPGLRPAHLQAVADYPVKVRAEFVIDRVGRAQGIRIDPATPSLFADAVRSVLQEPYAFWPAQGQCRFLEQDAQIGFEFAAPAAGAEITIVDFAALAVHSPTTAAIPQADALFAITSKADHRLLPALEGHPIDETLPAPTSKIKVRIPDELRHSQGLAGYAFLAFEVSAKGRVRDVTVHDVWSRVAGKEKHLGIEAMRAMREVVFTPATRHDAPIARRICYLVTFTTTAWGGDR